MKKVVFVTLLLCLALMATAQSKFDGFFKPVTLDQITVDGAKAGTSLWLFRPAATLSATVFSLGFDEVTGEFVGFDTGFLTKVGVGLSLAHFTEGEGEAVNNYSINGMLMLPTGGETKAALAVTASLFKMNIGFGYDLTKGAFKENIFFLTGVQFTF